MNRSGLNKDTLFKTFNCGVGLAIITDNPTHLLGYLSDSGIKSWKIGTVTTKGSGEISFNC